MTDVWEHGWYIGLAMHMITAWKGHTRRSGFPNGGLNNEEAEQGQTPGCQTIVSWFKLLPLLYLRLPLHQPGFGVWLDSRLSRAADVQRCFCVRLDHRYGPR